MPWSAWPNATFYGGSAPDPVSNPTTSVSVKSPARSLLSLCILALVTGCAPESASSDSRNSPPGKTGGSLNGPVASGETYEQTLAQVKTRMPAARYTTNEFIPAADTPPPEYTQRIKLKIGMPWLLNDEEAPWYIAVERKFFDLVGLDVELLSGGPAHNYLAVLAGGGVDLGVINMTTQVTKFIASPTGADVVIVGVTLRETPEAILAIDHETPRDQRSTRVLRATDFAGKTIAVETTSQYVMESVLALNGQSPAQVKFLRVSTLDTLVMGRVDAMASWIVNQPRLLEDAGYKNWMAYPLAEHGWEGAADVTVVRRDFLEKNPAVVRRYLWALRQAVEFMLDEPVAAAAITSRYATGQPLTPTQVMRRFELQRHLVIGDDRSGLLHVDPDAIDRTAAHMVRAGVISLPQTPR